MNRIGNQLIAQGHIDAEQLQHALDHQATVGGYLGQHLLEQGAITRAALYDALARQWDVMTRDLVLEPPHSGVTSSTDFERTLELGWVACELTADGVVVVATSVRPGPDLIEEVQEFFPGLSAEFVACTQRDLDHLASRARRNHADVQRAPASALARTATRSRLAAAFGATGFIVFALLAPLGVLAGTLSVAGSLFFLAVIVQSVVAVRLVAAEAWQRRRAARHRGAVQGPGAGEVPRDALLPMYSVLIPTSGAVEDVRGVVRQMETIDYPRSRLDAIMLIAEDDSGMLAAVKAAAPPDWFRVVSVAPSQFEDPVLACDAGLAAARGRYVVAYASDEEPAPDQLRRAVELFEEDLDENLERRPGRAPLAGLRTTHRVWGRAGSFATGRDVVDGALGLDRAYPWRGEFTALERELFSTHFNAHVLRRAGGWQAYVAATARTTDVAEPRMATLRSTSYRRVSPDLRGEVRRTAPAQARGHRLAMARARAWLVGEDFRGQRPTARQVLLGFTTPLIFLAYPVLLGFFAACLIRFAEAQDVGYPAADVGVVLFVVALVLASVLAGVLATWRQGGSAGLHALLLPAHWLMRSASAWRAVLALPR